MNSGEASCLRPRPFRIMDLIWDTSDTFTISLEPEDDVPLEFLPGQFTMLYAPGIGEAPISIAGDPARPEQLVHTIRVVGGVTTYLSQLKAGHVVGVRGPYGNGWPTVDAKGRDVIVIAGGIGLAPLRPVVYELLADRQGGVRGISLLYGARTPEDLLYLDELQEWRGRLDMDVDVTVDRGDHSWRGDVGVVTDLIRWARFDPDNVLAMVCGPEVMMRFVAYELAKRDVAAESIFLSMERNMKCGIGLCGRCQVGQLFVCTQGPVGSFARLGPILSTREL